MRTLTELRKKSSQVKSRYAFLGALVFTVGIGFIWATTLPAQFADIGETVKEAKDNQTAGVGFVDMVEKARQQIGTENLDSESSKTVESPAAENQKGQTAGEPYIQMNPGTSAFGGLNGWENSTTSSPKTEAAPIVSKEVKKSETPNTLPATTSPAVAPEPPTPTVILIGTTTSKRSE